MIPLVKLGKQRPKFLRDLISKDSFFRNRIQFIDHTHVIPRAYLPTFNSHVIEAFLHEIPGLAERFIYFNDDMFLGNRVSVSDFFDGLVPIHSYVDLQTVTGEMGDCKGNDCVYPSVCRFFCISII